MVARACSGCETGFKAGYIWGRYFAKPCNHAGSGRNFWFNPKAGNLPLDSSVIAAAPKHGSGQSVDGMAKRSETEI
jgi:hypothetical protein